MLSFIFGLLIAAPPALATPPIASVKNTVVVGSSTTDGSWSAIGSGVAVRSDDDQHLVMTARHVIVDDAGIPLPNIVVCGMREKEFTCQRVTEIKEETTRDLALLTLSEPVATPARVGKWIHTGQDVTMIGFPAGSGVVIQGQIIGRNHLGPHPDFLALGHCSPGMSGGGVFDHRGRVIGLVIAFGNDTDTVMGGHVHNLCYIQSLSLE
jgi:S1-C subfamily serine protease